MYPPPYLFNLYDETITRKACPNDPTAGIRIGGLKINNLRYTDDATLIAPTKRQEEQHGERQVKSGKAMMS